MSPRAASVTLLGPRPDPATLGPMLQQVAPEGPIAMVRAGWQEWESDDAVLSGLLEGRGVNLLLHERADRLWQSDPELTEAHRQMQRDIRLLRRAYNVRLAALVDAWATLNDLWGPDRVLGPERDSALDAIRTLDETQRDRVAEMRAAFARRVRLPERDSVAREREDVGGQIRDCAAVVVDGGHVAVLLNRMRLFSVLELIEDRPVVGISGGAMVLTDRVVLFHDTPPWGPGHAEVAESGLGLAPGICVFPHASHRLRLDDRDRVGRLAQRLAPSPCVLLDGGVPTVWDGDAWSAEGARRLTASGAVAEWEPPV